MHTTATQQRERANTAKNAKKKYVACETYDLVVMQVLSAAYASGTCTHAELAGLHGQRAISLAAAGRPLAAFFDNLTSVKVCTACLSVCLSLYLPARISASVSLPLTALMDILTSVKVCTAICLSVFICLFVCLPACLSVCLSHADTDTTNQGGHPDIACFYICLSASYQVSASYQKCCQEIVVYVCAFACSLT